MTWGRPVLSREEAQRELTRAYCQMMPMALSPAVSPVSFERAVRAAFVTIALMAELLPTSDLLRDLRPALRTAIVEDFAMAIGGAA